MKETDLSLAVRHNEVDTIRENHLPPHSACPPAVMETPRCHRSLGLCCYLRLWLLLKIWKLFIPRPNSNFPPQQNISNYTNINTVSASSKSIGLPEPLGSVRHRVNTIPVALGLMLGLPPSSFLFSPHPEFRSHRTQSSECAIWLFTVNLPWKCWSSPVDSGRHLVVILAAFGSRLPWAEASSWHGCPPLPLLKHTLPGTLPCWLEAASTFWTMVPKRGAGEVGGKVQEKK